MASIIRREEYRCPICNHSTFIAIWSCGCRTWMSRFNDDHYSHCPGDAGFTERMNGREKKCSQWQCAGPNESLTYHRETDAAE